MSTSWKVVQQLGLVVESPNSELLVYGSADPLPNPAELYMTQIVASRYKMGWMFFVYSHGKNLLMTVPRGWVNPPGVFNLENIIPPNLTLGEIARAIWQLRKEATIIAHLSPNSLLRATFYPEKKWLKGVHEMTIRQLHEAGGWLGGSAIHFLLRLWAEEMEEVLYLCPFQEKGRVYEIYKGVRRKLFLLTPFVRFVPPARLGFPSWVPTPWWYWRSLPASFRRRVRKEVKKRMLLGERRIEIPLP